jgi:hypothetical protein
VTEPFSPSASYNRRRQSVLWARGSALAAGGFFLLMLVSGCMVESWLVKQFASVNVGLLEFVIYLSSVGCFLFLYSLGLCRLTLHFSYWLESLRSVRFGIQVLFLLAYGYAITGLDDIRLLLPVAASKVLSAFLFFRFWESQIVYLRLRRRKRPQPREFLLSGRAFFVCRWILVACWLLHCLGFALSLLSSDPVVDLAGWESLLLLGGFYLLFRVFVRNPYAHPVVWSDPQHTGN